MASLATATETVTHRKLPRLTAYAAMFAFSRPNSPCVRENCETPQSKQTKTFGNTNAPGLSRFLSPAKWIIISETNCVWFSDPRSTSHDRPQIPTSLSWRLIF
jgi:hypothetical protein